MFGNGVKTRVARTGARSGRPVRGSLGKRHSNEKDSGIFFKMPARRLRHAPIGQPIRRQIYDDQSQSCIEPTQFQLLLFSN